MGTYVETAFIPHQTQTECKEQGRSRTIRRNNSFFVIMLISAKFKTESTLMKGKTLKLNINRNK